ncbi:MAG: sulfatase-like hydrolase/transferase [Singulisphaera sp.]|nr:sulfatase-like hydrolase/transferase [Singulisphaera sp.]
MIVLTVVGLLFACRNEAGSRRVHAERPATAPGSRPNLLILIGDDHGGGTLGIDGDPRQATPRLDALARRGVRFDRAYCNSPVCTASRQSLLTGRLPHAVGVTRLEDRLPDDAVTLGTWLGDLGYETAAIGKMHFNGRSRHGFAERIDLEDWRDHMRARPPQGIGPRRPWRPFVDPAAEWLNAACRSAGLPESAMEATFFADKAIEFLRRSRQQPFALVVGFYEPHAPFKFPREWEGRYRPEQFDVPEVSEADRHDQPRVFASLTADDVRGIQAAYYTSLAFVDHEVGRILDALDASGKAEDTLVVYLGDNGYLRGQHGRFEKHCFYEPAVRVPLVFRWPGRLPEGRRIDELVELVDVLPTVLRLFDLPQPPGLQGRDLASLLTGASGAAGRDVVFSEYLENEEAMVRSKRYKLIVGTGNRLRKDGYQTGHPLPGPYERLYNLEADPAETTDLGGGPDLTSVRAELRRRLYERLVSTREGLPPIPPGLSEIDAIRWCLVPRERQP